MPLALVLRATVSQREIQGRRWDIVAGALFWISSRLVILLEVARCSDPIVSWFVLAATLFQVVL
jgi:hypothetical protein